LGRNDYYLFKYKNIPYDFSEKNALIIRFLAKFLFTIATPLILVRLLYKEKDDFGIYFPTYRESFKLTWRALSVAGPAGFTFLFIRFLGWRFEDWKGSTVLSIVFLAVFSFTPKVISNLLTRRVISILTIGIAYNTYNFFPYFGKYDTMLLSSVLVKSYFLESTFNLL
jgi:hypothetical protein